MKVTTIKSARTGSATVHLGEDIGWGSRPFCPALRTGRREVDPHASGTVNCRPCIKEANRQFLDVEHLIQISTRVRNLIKAVREHAVANYNVGAWDIIVEAYSDSELAETVGKCRTAAGAIAKVAKIVELFTERRAPHDAEIAAATEPAHPCGVADHDHISAVSASQCVVLRGGVNKPEVQPQPESPAEADGSVVSCRWAHDGELLSATRTWPGKVGHAEIQIDGYEDEPAEYYYPGWRGQAIESATYCNHDVAKVAAGGVCYSPDCRRRDCVPF